MKRHWWEDEYGIRMGVVIAIMVAIILLVLLLVPSSACGQVSYNPSNPSYYNPANPGNPMNYAPGGSYGPKEDGTC